MAREVLHQEFNWHDERAAGEYRFGEQGYLVMDGSEGRIQCSRLIEPLIDSCDGAIEVSFRVYLSYTYQVCLYDCEDRLVIRTQIDPDGWIEFQKGENWERVGGYLTYCFGVPTVDPKFRPPEHTRESDETTFRFEGFNFANRKFRFSHGDGSFEVKNAFQVPAENIAKIEVLTPKVEPGTVFRLRSFVHEVGNEVVEQDEFTCHWDPVEAPPDGHNYDHISSIRLFPKEHRWLQTVTQYGWAKMRFPRVETGELEYELMTPDVIRESAFLLEETHPTIEQGCRAHTGIARGRFFCAGPEERRSEITDTLFKQDRLFYFEDPIPEPNRIYRFRVAWDSDGYRIWIGGVTMKLGTGEILPFEMANKTYVGIDTITLHPGM